MSSPQLKSNQNFEITDIVDSGYCGTVYRIKVHENQRVYTVKQINLKRLENDEKLVALHDAKMEYYLLKKEIPNVLRSFGSFHETEKEVYKFSTEYIEMSLEQLIQSNGKLRFMEFINIFKDILSGKITSPSFTIFTKKYIHRLVWTI